MKKYLRLTCSLCRRDIDKLVDITHYTPDRCTITQGCEGRLQPLEYRSSAGIAVSPEVGVKDWQPRGTSTIPGTKIILPPALLNLQTGSKKQIVIGSQEDNPNGIVVRLNGKADAPKAYRSYVFRREDAFQNISGVESGLEKKALRFTTSGENPDMVEVYVNGVKREMGTGPNDYQIAASNTITFNTTIDEPSITQVDVIVSKDVPTATYALTFKRNKKDESRTGTGAYENVDYVEGMINGDQWVRYYLYTLDLDTISGTIPLNSILVPAQPSDIIFMLARRPYTQLDRYSTAIVRMNGMSVERDFIKYYAQDDETTARVTVAALDNTFPPLRFTKFTVEKPIASAIPGVAEQLVVDGKVITGPDA